MAKIGSETRPVYVGANGEARPCDVDLHDISVENKGDNEVIAIITIDGTPYNIKNFKQGGNAFVVTFKDWNGTVLKTEAVLKGGNATPPTNPTREGYDFDKWDGKYTNVQQDETVTASYTQKMLTVTFKLNGGNISGSTADVVINNVAYGTKFSEVKKLVTNPTRTSTAQYNYTFNGWDKDDTLEIKTNTTATAQWNSVERYYTVTFKNYNATSAAAGTTLETKSVKYGATPAYTGTTPSVESPVTGKTYTWNSSDGWTPALSAVTGDAVYVAKYTEGAATVTVTFNLDGGNIGGSTDPVVRTVNYGTALSDVTKPDNPSKTGYNFTSWGDPDPASAISSDSKVIGNCVITANYVRISAFVLCQGSSAASSVSTECHHRYSTDKTMTWNGTAGDGIYKPRIAYCNGRFLIYGSGNAMYSDDCGNTWTSTAYSAGSLFMILGGDTVSYPLTFVRGTYYMHTSTIQAIKLQYSRDGETWEDGVDSDGHIINSNDGTHLGKSFAFGKLRDGNSYFATVRVCGASDADHAYTSPLGDVWRRIGGSESGGEAYSSTAVWHLKDRFIARSYASNTYFLTECTDGTSFDKISSGFGSSTISKIEKMLYANGYYVAWVYDGSLSPYTHIYVSTDDTLMNWTDISAFWTSSGFRITDICFGDGIFVVVGYDKSSSNTTHVYTTTNPLGTWAETSSLNDGRCTEIQYGVYGS